MTQQALFKLLSELGTITIQNWKIVTLIHKYMPQITVKEKQWGEKYKQDNPDWYPLDLSKLEIWSTFQECVIFKFNVENNNLICTASVYEQGVLHTFNLRFKAVLVMPSSFIKEIQDEIMWRIEKRAVDAYNEHLKEQENKFIKDFLNKLLLK